MMGLSILPSPTTLDNAVALVNAMLDPARAKEILQQLSDQTTSLNRLRGEILEMQKQVDADRAAADAALAEARQLKTEADAAYAALSNDRARLAAWEEEKRQIKAALAEIEARPARGPAS
jgi:septal ring factor EnvC (AmiA/AmiB activator)